MRDRERQMMMWGIAQESRGHTRTDFSELSFHVGINKETHAGLICCSGKKKLLEVTRISKLKLWESDSI